MGNNRSLLKVQVHTATEQTGKNIPLKSVVRQSDSGSCDEDDDRDGGSGGCSSAGRVMSVRITRSKKKENKKRKKRMPVTSGDADCSESGAHLIHVSCSVSFRRRFPLLTVLNWIHPRHENGVCLTMGSICSDRVHG